MHHTAPTSTVNTVFVAKVLQIIYFVATTDSPLGLFPKYTHIL